MERPCSALTAPAANNPRTSRRFIALVISHLIRSDHETRNSFCRPDVGRCHGVAAGPIALRRPADRRTAYGGGGVGYRCVRAALRREDLHVARNAAADAHEVRRTGSDRAPQEGRA